MPSQSADSVPGEADWCTEPANRLAAAKCGCAAVASAPRLWRLGAGRAAACGATPVGGVHALQRLAHERSTVPKSNPLRLQAYT